jgi:hypothetical protein
MKCFWNDAAVLLETLLYLTFLLNYFNHLVSYAVGHPNYKFPFIWRRGIGDISYFEIVPLPETIKKDNGEVPPSLGIAFDLKIVCDGIESIYTLCL